MLSLSMAVIVTLPFGIAVILVGGRDSLPYPPQAPLSAVPLQSQTVPRGDHVLQEPARSEWTSH